MPSVTKEQFQTIIAKESKFTDEEAEKIEAYCLAYQTEETANLVFDRLIELAPFSLDRYEYNADMLLITMKGKNNKNTACNKLVETLEYDEIQNSKVKLAHSAITKFIEGEKKSKDEGLFGLATNLLVGAATIGATTAFIKQILSDKNAGASLSEREADKRVALAEQAILGVHSRL